MITLEYDLKNADASDELLEAIEHVETGMELHNYTCHYLSRPKLSQRELICSNGIHAD